MYEDQSGEFVWGTEQRAGRVIGVLTIERKIPNLSDGTEELLESLIFRKFRTENKEYVP